MSPRQRLLLESAAIAITGALTAFLLLTLLHSQLDHLRPFDLTIQAHVHGWTNPLLTRMMTGLTFIGSIEVFIPTLVVAVLFFLILGEREGGIRLIRKRQTSALFAFAVGGAILLNETLKTHFHRIRPHVPWSIGAEHTFSFPSGHSLFSSVLYGLIAYLVLSRHSPMLHRAIAAALAIALPLAIGLSRIYLGMHFPTDVLAGFITGAVWLSATIALDRRWQAHAVQTRHSRH